MEKFDIAKQSSVIVTVLDDSFDWASLRKIDGEGWNANSPRDQFKNEAAASQVIADFMEQAGLGDESTGFVEETDRFRSFVVMPRGDISKLGVDESIMELSDPMIFFGKYECYGINLLLDDCSETVMIQVCEIAEEDVAACHRAGWASKAGSTALLFARE